MTMTEGVDGPFSQSRLHSSGQSLKTQAWLQSRGLGIIHQSSKGVFICLVRWIVTGYSEAVIRWYPSLLLQLTSLNTTRTL